MPDDATVFGEQPRPRVLVAWKDPSAEILEVLARFAGSTKAVTRLGEVRQRDFDVLITNQMSGVVGHASTTPNRVLPEPHLFVFSVASAPGGATVVDEWKWGGRTRDVSSFGGHVSGTVLVPKVLPASVDDLVRDHLVPVCRARARHVHETITLTDGRGSLAALARQSQFSPGLEPGLVPLPPDIRPFVLTPDGAVLAGSYARSYTSEGWALPADTSRVDLWLAAALRHWALGFAAFPLLGAWTELPRWQTAAELEHATTLTAATEALARETARLNDEIAQAVMALEAAQRNAARGSSPAARGERR